MPTFIYKATNSAGEIMEGEIVASGKNEGLKTLASRHLIPIEIHLKKEKKIKLSSSLFSKKITTLDKARFCERLSVLIDAGINIRKILEILIQDETKPNMKKFFSDLKANVERGGALHVTFEDYKKVFSPAFIGLIKSGEASGNLTHILKQLAVDLRKEQDLKRKIISASIYPLILLVSAGLILGLLLIYILPRLIGKFVESGVELPFFTQLLMSISQWSRDNFVLVLIGLFALIIFIKIFKKTNRGKIYFAKVIGIIPLVGKLEKKIVLNRFCRTFSMLLGSGVVLIESLKITSEVVGNEIYKKIILDDLKLVQKGISLSDLFKKHPKYFPYLLVGTIRAGEESGKLSEILEPVAGFYEEEVDSAIGSLSTILEPLLLLIIGSLIAIIALSVLLPIYQMVGGI